MPELNWVGKKAVLNHHNRVPYRLLKCDSSLSAGDPSAGNLLVQGDNLEALKALLPYYAGQVKCIYIDPPYNTGNEGWVYNDNVNSPEIRQWLGRAVGAEAEDLSRHDKWLCMMYPRLAILKEFLSNDGVIIIHIDEHEVSRLHLLLEELFGSRNFLGAAIWDKGNPKGDAFGLAYQHETVVFCCRNRAVFETSHGPLLEAKPNADRMIKKAASLCSRIGNVRVPDDFADFAKTFKLSEDCIRPHRQRYQIEDAKREFERWVKAEPGLTGGERQYFRIIGDASSDQYRVYRLASMAWPNKQRAPDDYFRPLMHPVTRKPCPVPARGWRFPPATIEKMLPDKIEFGVDHNVQPQQRLYLDEYLCQRLASIVRDARSTDLLFAELGIRFENAKPHELAVRLISAVSSADSLILDSFAGSGTTAHAVLQMNNANGGGNCRFICVEMSGDIARNVTAVRIRKVIEGYGETPGLGGGFRFCTLGEPLTDDAGNIRSSVGFRDLAHHVFFTETGLPLPKKATAKNPFLGDHEGTAYYLLFNGVLGDKRPNGGNVLTTKVLESLPPHTGRRVVYGEGCRLTPARLKRDNIVFRQIPYEVKVG